MNKSALDTESDSARGAPSTPTEHGVQVCIIGAGVSGLTAAKALSDAGVSFECFEQGSALGGMWRYCNDSGTSSAYRSLHIDSSRQSLSFPDFAIPDDQPDYLSHTGILRHLENYADTFDLQSRIRFRCRVEQVRPTADGQWEVSFTRLPATGNGATDEHGESASETRCYRQLIVANGHLWDPRYPDFPGQFDGTALHSHHYRTADPFDDRSVLVVGIGNSAVDIAVDLARRARSVVLSTRRSAWIMPKYIAGIPTDRWLRVLTRRLKLPVAWARGLLRHIARLAIGNQERFGVPRPKHPVGREHATLSQELLPYIGHGWIRMKPNVRRLAGTEVEFEDGSREPVDAIVYATGYRTRFPFLDEALFHVEEGVPPTLFRRIVAVDAPGLFFAGLVQPIGPTITLVEIQARWMAAVLSGRIELPAADDMRREIEAHRARVAKDYLNAARYTLEVDFKSYARDLEQDIQRASATATAGRRG